MKLLDEENSTIKKELQLYIKKYDEVKDTMDKNDEAMHVYDEKLSEVGVGHAATTHQG